MNEYLATFYTHYGAVKFLKFCGKNGAVAKQAPVPRLLSASCGTCVIFNAPSRDFAKGAEDMEACFLCETGGYKKILYDEHTDS